jgi:hypothetical protein
MTLGNLGPMDATALNRPLPGWLNESVEVLAARRRIVVAAAVGLTLLGGIVALIAPSLLPPRPLVGAAVGLAAVLLATALGLAVDAADLVVRGQRHIAAAGGTVAARVARDPDDVGPLMARVAQHAQDGRIRVALTPASRSAGVPGARAGALAKALAQTGRKVLLTDLTRGGTPAAGLSDVLAGDKRLAEVVRFDQDLYLARLAVGSDPERALAGFAEWAADLPPDLEVLVAALPPLAEPGVLAAAAMADVVFVQVEVDRTERVDLIASLDAVDTTGMTAELVLVDPSRAVPGRGVVVPPDEVAAPEPAAEPEAAGEPDVAALVEEPAPDEAIAPEDLAEPEPAPRLEPIPDPIPEPEPEPEPEPDPEPQPEPEPEPQPEPLPQGPASQVSVPVASSPVPPVPQVPAASAASDGPSRYLRDIWAESPSEPPTDDPTEPIVMTEAVSGADMPESPAPEPASDAPVASPHGPAAAARVPDSGDADLDAVAQEAVRRTAALQALAQEVWRRESGS